MLRCGRVEDEQGYELTCERKERKNGLTDRGNDGKDKMGHG